MSDKENPIMTRDDFSHVSVLNLYIVLCCMFKLPLLTTIVPPSHT